MMAWGDGGAGAVSTVPDALRRATRRDFAALQASADPVVAQQSDSAGNASGKRHSHRRGQLICVMDGRATVETEEGPQLLGAGQGVWLPGGVAHRVSALGNPVFRSLYVREDLAAGLRPGRSPVAPRPFLQEIIGRLVAIYEARLDPALYPHLVALALAELPRLPPRPALPMPQDPRLLGLCRALVERPGDRRPLAELAREAGASVRTLERRFLAQTGLTFEAWRRACRLRAAMDALAQGAPVQRVAWICGYDSQSAFAAMFRKETGLAPTAYRREAQQSISMSSAGIA